MGEQTDEIRPIVLAAGKGTRMRSELPKVLHRAAGRPLLRYLLDALQGAGFGRPVVVIGFGGDLIQQLVGEDADYVWQNEQRGTGHAVQLALDAFPDLQTVLVVNGDLPLLSSGTLARLVEERGVGAAMLTARVDHPTGFGRVVRDQAGAVRAIVEERDATDEQRRIDEVNVGAYLTEAASLHTALSRVGDGNAQGEIYLVDAIAALAATKLVQPVVAPAQEVHQVNDRAQLAEVETRIRHRQVERLMRDGVTVIDPATTYVDAEVVVGRDSVIHPFTFLEGETRIGDGCAIGPQTRVVDSEIGHGCRVEFSVVEETKLGDGCSAGPFSHLRPGTVAAAQVSIGNFVEIKAVQVGERTKVRHHSYLGNAQIGADANIGAGTVIVNYDGRTKHFSTIGDSAFIGCNANLISPVKVADGAYVAAGSTVTHDVPPAALAVARERQRNIEGWVARKRRNQEGD